MKLNDIKEKDIKEIADSTRVLERGIDYFHSGRVKSVCFEGDTISANIIGSSYRDYTTKVWCAKDDLEWKCTCPYDGWCCKHVVAVLYYFIKNKSDMINDLKEEDKKMTVIGKELQNLDKNSLTNIILELINKNRDIKIDLLEMLDKNYKCNNNEQIYIQQYNEYWNAIDPILDLQEAVKQGWFRIPGKEEVMEVKTHEDVKKVFRHEVYCFSNGLRLTKLVQRNKKP